MDERQQQPSRSAWALVAVSCFCFGVSVIHAYGFGAFIQPIEREMHWSRSQITAGLLMNSIMAGLFAPFVGELIDRYGPRRIALPGMAVYCAAIALLSVSGANPPSWLGLWLLVAFGSLMVKPTVWTAAVVSRFGVKSGFALSAMLCGAAAIVLPPLGNWLIDHHGWRTAFVAIGLGSGVIAVPLIWLFFDAGPKAAQPPDTMAPAAPGSEAGSARALLLSWKFARFGTIAFLMNALMQGLQVHFIPLLSSHAVPSGQAASIAALIGFGSIAGRLATGALLDRWNGPYVGAATFLLPVVTALVLLASPTASLVQSVAAAVSFGLALGGEISVIAYLVTRYFGLGRYGLVFGSISSILAVAAGVGPAYASFIYDMTGSYHLFLLSAIGVAGIGALLTGTLGPYPDDAGGAAVKAGPVGTAA